MFRQLITPMVNSDIPDKISVNIATANRVLDKFRQTRPQVTITREMLLAPIVTCPIISVVGVNYEHHIQETGQSVYLISNKTFYSLIERCPYHDSMVHSPYA